MAQAILGNPKLKFIKGMFYMAPPPPQEKYLTIEALEDDTHIYFEKYIGGQIWYSFDKLNWIEVVYIYERHKDEWGIIDEKYVQQNEFPILSAGQTLYIKGTLWQGIQINEGIGRFEILTPYNLSGNCNSLIFCDDAPSYNDLTGYNSCYKGLFSGCEGLMNISHEFLPATTLANNCYYEMFRNCTSLVNIPKLPATTLTEKCYYGMFRNCSSLVSAPALPATTLAAACYYKIFSGTNILPDCTNIDFTSESVVSSGGLRGLFAGTKVTDNDLYDILPINQSTGKYWLPVTTLADYCYDSMFQDCALLVTAPELPATTLVKYCYQNMFRGCTSIIKAPELPATTLVSSCYQSMFNGCTKLNYIKALFTTTPGTSYTTYWVDGVSSKGTFVKSRSASWNVTGDHGIPSGWTVQTA